MGRTLTHIGQPTGPKVAWSVTVQFGHGWSVEGTMMARNEVEVRRAVFERFGDAAGSIRMTRINADG